MFSVELLVNPVSEIAKDLLTFSKLWQLVAEELHEAGGACEAAAVEHSDKARRPARKGNHPVGIFIIISAR